MLLCDLPLQNDVIWWKDKFLLFFFLIIPELCGSRSRGRGFGSTQSRLGTEITQIQDSQKSVCTGKEQTKGKRVLLFLGRVKTKSGPWTVKTLNYISSEFLVCPVNTSGKNRTIGREMCCETTCRGVMGYFGENDPLIQVSQDSSRNPSWALGMHGQWVLDLCIPSSQLCHRPRVARQI